MYIWIPEWLHSGTDDESIAAVLSVTLAFVLRLAVYLRVTLVAYLDKPRASVT